jgi:tetratricopeptide (TPR) repeat protein
MFINNTKPLIINYILVILFTILLTVTYDISYGQITKQDAKDWILKELLKEKLGKVDVYISKDIVRKKDGLKLWKKQLAVPYTECWIFFVDEMPFANWEHPCSYIFVNKETGEYEIVKEKIHPADLNQFEVISNVKHQGGLGKMLKTYTPSVIQTVSPNEHLYAVIINGCDWQRYWNDISAMYCTLVDVYGYPEQNILVHYGDGTSSFGNDFNNDNINDIDYNANKSTIERTFRNLAGEWTNDPNVPELGPDDQLFIFIDDHGGHNGSSSYICLQDYDLYPDELADYIENINCSSMIFVMEQCHSGGFENEITNVTNAACKHRVIHTACGEYEYSWAEIWISNAMYDEFVFYWTAAARGYYPDPNGDYPWQTSYATGNFPFGNYFASHPSDYNPDDNEDGKVQMEEAFTYANDFDTRSPVGYYNPYDGSENPVTNNMSGFQEDLLDLTGFSGTIYNNQTISGDFIVSGDLSIFPGVTLSISAGSKYYFVNNRSELIVNGSLNAQGTSANNITFTSTSGTWGGIRFNSGSSGTLSYCTIQNAQYGIYCNGYLPNITNCTIENNYIGINLYNTGVQTNSIANNTIRNNTTYGINMTYSSPRNIYGNEIYGNGQAGMYCSSNSIPYIYENEITDNGAAGITFLLYSAGQLGNSGSGGYNLITGNTWGVGCGYESDVIIGTTDQCGYNSIHDNSSYEVTGEYDSHVMAENNWWNRTPPNYPNYYYTGDFYTQMGGTIDYAPALTSDPLGGLMKISSYGISEQNKEVAGVQSEDSFIDSGLRDALSNLLEGKYEEAITKYEKRFKEETNESKRKYILRRISDCYNLSGRRGFAEHLNNELMVDKTRDNELYATAAALESLNLINEKRYEEAIRNIEKLKEENPDNESIEKISLYNLISLYKDAVNNEGKAREYYAELRDKYPGDEITIHSGILLGEDDRKMNYEVLNKEENKKTDEVEKGYEITNYPNPFNPTTVISYQLPEKNYVTLKVYDILGREIATLINEYQNAGSYKVEFSADKYNLSSGIYFYTLKAGKNYVVKKMMLAK